jgi:hypothetical protein
MKNRLIIMENDHHLTQERLRENKELDDLRNLLALKGITSELEMFTTWFSLKKMQKELELPSLSPIKEHYSFYRKLVKIHKILNLSTMDFVQLNQLYVEITSYRELLGLPETTLISKIISDIRSESLQTLASLGVKYDSLLLQVILQSTMSSQEVIASEERTPIENDLDRIMFEILKSYGPLTRPELVHITGAPRSSIYDSLQRLIVMGYAVQYSEKRSHTGRPTTVFDALI